MTWRATKVCVFGGYSERDGVDILVPPDDARAQNRHWHVFVWVPPGADPTATGWVLAEGWLSRADADAEADEIVKEHRCERVAPAILPGTTFSAADAMQLRPVKIPAPL